MNLRSKLDELERRADALLLPAQADECDLESAVAEIRAAERWLDEFRAAGGADALDLDRLPPGVSRAAVAAVLGVA